MSAFLSKGWFKKLDIMCSKGFNWPNFTSVNYFNYFRGATRVIQAGRIGSPENHDGMLNSTSTGSRLPSGLHKEHRRCVANQAALRADQSDASLIRMTLPIHRRPNGVIHGSFLVDNIVQAATMAANRYCNRDIDNGERGHHGAILCFLSSFDYLKYVQPLSFLVACCVKANVTAAFEHVLHVEVSVEENYPFVSDTFKLANSARLSFITSDHHDFNQKYNIIPQKSDAGDLNDSQPLQPTQSSKVKDVDHSESDFNTLVPHSSFVSFIQPYNSMPPQHAFSQPGHVCKLMEEHGIILTSRLTQHDVVCVHMGSVTFHEHIRSGSVVVTSGEVVSTAEDVLTVFQTVHLISDGVTKTRKRCVAEGLFSYVPINSSKERVFIPGLQISSERGQSFIQDKEFGIEHNIVDSYVNDLKNPILR